MRAGSVNDFSPSVRLRYNGLHSRLRQGTELTFFMSSRQPRRPSWRRGLDRQTSGEELCLECFTVVITDLFAQAPIYSVWLVVTAESS